MSHPSIVSKQIRMRHPDLFEIGEGSVIDDFCYFSTRMEVGRFSHIANGCSVGGGAHYRFRLGDYSSLSAGVRVWCASDDYVHDLVTLIPPGIDVHEIKTHFLAGDVTLGDMTAVGSNAVIMPNNSIPEGVALGALSFVPPSFAFEPWMVYAGIPLRPIGPRDRDTVLAQRDKLVRAIAAQSGEDND